ncbi:ADP-ribosylglycohydrolase family protein [Alkaliphilus pronyensis]|uniref:ADP-ribosylglycohydrolase family protein n=1 Tax=Alkaliphilus pronyensis TaxID=1482732 RepID=A0A6I0FA66_9FIRM|nr:ADP-ribosylglycohydrolase family protein [Alkaliphilus pronyensis]KAB3534377.1 ADP-ribosylglycohydrolase family protein [Alkaliphilus pronyensis]
MTKEKLIKQAYTMMAYGDALGLLYENTEIKNGFKDFTLKWDEDIDLEQEAGQYSDITELLIILTKSLIDDIENSRVIIDKARLIEELKLFKYYRHGNPVNLLDYISNPKIYSKSPAYHNDRRGYGISRVSVLLFANKNLSVAVDEIFKHIITVNRHPVVILTGLLIARCFYILLGNREIDKFKLAQQLKEYLINLKREDLDDEIASNSYSIKYEKEKIEFIMELDRMKDMEDISPKNKHWDSKNMFIAAIINFFRLKDSKSISFQFMPKDDVKESLSLSYGFLGIVNTDTIEAYRGFKNNGFIESMGEYINKLRHYEIKRNQYLNININIDLFNQKQGSVIKHPIFNLCKIVGIKENDKLKQVHLNTKSGDYVLTKTKS